MCMIVVKSIGHDENFKQLNTVINLIYFVDNLKFNILGVWIVCNYLVLTI